MAFAQIAATPTDTAGASSSTTHTITLPTPVAGHKWLVVVGVRQQLQAADVTWSGITLTSLGSVLQGTSTGIWCWTRDVDGSEPSTATLNLVTAHRPMVRIYPLSAAAAMEFAGAASGNVATPDPPALDPAGWGTEDTLWLAFAANNSGTTLVTTWPTNYTNTGQLNAGVVGSPSLGYGTRELNAASEDPGTFTYSAATPSAAATVGVQPGGDTTPPAAPTGGSLTLTTVG